MNEETLFELARTTPLAERAALLDRECAMNPELRRRVEMLLEAHEEPAEFLETTQLFDPETNTIPNILEKAIEGVVLAEKYRLLQPIGEGGMGTVWLAQQSAPLKRKVAVKLIKAGMDSNQVLKRFETERQALALMDHPNIAKVLDGGVTDDGRPFFVMELVKGVPITEYCDANRLTPQERLELFIPVCQAIQHAHQKGVIHRDIKPSNVLIALYDDKPVPKVIDFGLAKATGQALTDQTLSTALGAVVGTPQYMSPEQATLNNLDIDTRSDVYSLGVLLYELLTGSPPFSKTELEKKGLLEILRCVREDEPPKPSTKLSTSEAAASISANRNTEPKKLASILRNDLDWILLKTLEKDRTRRYETANGFAADLMRYLAGEAVVAHPPSTGYRLMKALRKNRKTAIAIGLVAAALLLGMVGTSLGLVQAQKAQQAEGQRAESELAAKQEAIAAKTMADDERNHAEIARDAAQRQVVRLDIATAAHEADRGEFELALHWAARAWQDDRGRMKPGEVLSTDADANHRMRVASAIDRLPRLVGFCPHERQILDADCDLTGEWAVSLCGSPTKFDPDKFGSHGDRESFARVWKTARAELAYPPLQHDGPITSIRFSPDGTYIGTASLDGTAKIWETKTGKLFFTVRSEQPILHLDFHPDGTAFAIATGERIEQFNMQSGKATRHPIAVGKTVDYAVYSPEGRRLMSVTRAGQVRVWDSLTGKALSEPLPFFRIGDKEVREKFDFSPHFESQRWPVFSPDGQQLATNDGYSLLIWSDSGVRRITANTGNDPAQIAAAFAADGNELVFIKYKTFVHRYSLTEGKELAPTNTARLPLGLAISADAKRIAVPITKGNTWAFRLPNFEPTGPLLRHTDFVTRLRFTADGRRLMTASLDGGLRIFEDGPSDRTLDPQRLDFGRADRLDLPNKRYSHDGKWVAEYSPTEGKMRLGQVGGTSVPLPSKIAMSPRFEHDDSVQPVFRPLAKFNPIRDEFTLYSLDPVSSEPQIESWKYSDDPPERIGVWKSPGAVLNLTYSEDGRRLAVSLHLPDRPSFAADRVSCYQVLDFPALKPLAPPFGLELSRLRERVAFTKYGEIIAGIRQGTATVPAWNVRTSERLNIEVGTGNILGLDFGSHDDRLLVAQTDRTIRQLNPRTGERIGPTILLPTTSKAAGSTVAYSPDQARFVQTLDGNVLICSSEHGDVLATIATDQNHFLPSVWFGSDGKRVVCNVRGSTYVWQSLLPEYTGTWEDVPTLVKLLTGLEPDPAGGFSALAHDAIRRDVEAYRKAYLAWQASVAHTVRPKVPRIPVRIVHPGRAENHDRVMLDFREIHDADVAGLAKWFEQLPKNFRPSHLSVQEGSNGTRFDAIAIDDGTATPFEAHLALSHKKTEPLTLDQDDQDMFRKGWNRILISGYFDSTGYRRHQIWSKVSGYSPSWRMQKEFTANIAKLKASKSMPLSVTQYDDGLALITAPDDGHDWECFKDLTAEQVKTKILECKERKWRPSMVHRHRTDADKFLLTLIDNPHDEAWEYEANLSIAEYESKLTTNKVRGFRPGYVHSWIVSKEPVYSVIWLGRPNNEPIK
jgi:serine/threonine protein kinase/WD40 repeat protein